MCSIGIGSTCPCKSTRSLSSQHVGSYHPSKNRPTSHSSSSRVGSDSIRPCSYLYTGRIPTNRQFLTVFLSGQKVRLTGPVGGRGTICRDLGMDLTRIAHAGTRAIICCLDDLELGFLGVKWGEYVVQTEKWGIDLIRLPLAEGFAPLDLVAFDRALTSVVMDYTLRGTTVLAHCRGGVGRAGLVAAAWMIKMGFVRSREPVQREGLETGGSVGPVVSELIETPAQLSESTASIADTTNLDLDAEEMTNGTKGEKAKEVETNALALATEAIYAIRSRRSPKAIETAEQVDFLIQYARYLLLL